MRDALANPLNVNVNVCVAYVDPVKFASNRMVQVYAFQLGSIVLLSVNAVALAVIFPSLSVRPLYPLKSYPIRDGLTISVIFALAVQVLF